LIQPFWAVPILSVTGLRFGEMVGYTSLVALVCFVVSLAAMVLIPATL
jgi:short-chain fatty acids transporter